MKAQLLRLSLSWSQGTGSIPSVSSAFCVPALKAGGSGWGLKPLGGSLLRGRGAGHQPLRWLLLPAQAPALSIIPQAEEEGLVWRRRQ